MKFIKQSIRPAIMLLIISLIVIGCAGILDSYTPATFTIDGDRSVMSGVIDGSTPERVQALIDEHPNVKTIIMQQVDGSTDDEANVVAARLVRKHGFNTHVPANGEIASGGVDFFLAGVERTVETGARLGVHSWAAGDGETGATVPKDDPQHKLYLDYYAEMGIPADFYWFTLQAAPAEDIHWMTVAELEEYQMITSPPLVRAAPKSAAQTDKFYATGNPESDVVIVNAQGGPVPFLFTDDFAEMFGAVSLKGVYLVNVHQAQTLGPARFIEQEISFEEAKAFDAESVQRLAAVVSEFKNAGKQVYVVGISFGAFVVQDLLATQGNVADGYLLAVGRLDMQAEVWQPFSERRFVGFADGVEVVELAGADEAGMGGDGSFADTNMAKLAAGLGHKRYTELLADVDLSNVLYVYGKLDEQVGRLSDAELAFLDSKAVNVLASAEGHGGGETDRLTNEALAQLLGTDLVNTGVAKTTSEEATSAPATNGTLPTTADELEQLMMNHLKLTSQDALHDHLDTLSRSGITALTQGAVGLQSQADVAALINQRYGEEDASGANGETEPSFGTAVSDTASASNGKLTIQVEFMDSVQLENGESRPWSTELKQPYIDAANQWLKALIGIEGKEAHTITIQVTVNTLDGGNGAASPSEEETIGDFTLPVKGELIVGNHTYAAGFDQVEFYANILHEIGHIIGVGSFTEAFVTDDAASGGPIFRGLNSNKGVEMYNEIYGTAVDFVPISDDRGHLYDYVLQEDTPRTFVDGSPLPPLTKEFMANGHSFGKVTLGILDDIGYVVDYSAAESYVP